MGKDTKISWCDSTVNPGARPMDDDWVRILRHQCETSGTAFFFKQRIEGGRKVELPELDGRRWHDFPAALAAATTEGGGA